MSVVGFVMSVADKLIQLANIRSDIRSALLDKGISAENHNFSDFAEDVADIPSGGTDGIFSPLDIPESDMIPTMTLKYNGGDI